MTGSVVRHATPLITPLDGQRVFRVDKQQIRIPTPGIAPCLPAPGPCADWPVTAPIATSSDPAEGRSNHPCHRLAIWPQRNSDEAPSPSKETRQAGVSVRAEADAIGTGNIGFQQRRQRVGRQLLAIIQQRPGSSGGEVDPAPCPAPIDGLGKEPGLRLQWVG